MHLGQYYATIHVDGALLPEYAIELSNDGMEATCWIPSQNNKNFSIELKNTNYSHRETISGRIAVDGIKCGGLHLACRSGGRTSTAQRDSVSTSANTRRPLTFGQQALTDDDAYLNAAISPDLGTIKVDFCLVQVSRKKKDRKWYVRHEPRILHEHSKKGIGHSIQFGPEFHRQNPSKMTASHTIQSMARFNFKYRPIGTIRSNIRRLRLLRAEGITPPAPREERAATPPDVVDLSMEVDEDDAEEAEIKKLKMKLEALKNKRQPKQVKREASFEVKKEIKREGPIFLPGEVIDLT
ncbi:hypothetical protein C8F04DRAFT_1084238 [Mycena alexandri]|uniref:DUF7918 domain-containing protein n=1 Tax=Mycena alexandri TaxID=1745969 RepID=A0AAD6X862_9AGAR|nr:hypothetical protein C8F04DRAFT_1084238 [Mycena alexandri]